MKKQIQLGNSTCLASWNRIHIILKGYRFKIYQVKGCFYLIVHWANVGLMTDIKTIWDIK